MHCSQCQHRNGDAAKFCEECGARLVTEGKQHEAHRMLSEIYNWFTEGLDTKDLQEAKALIEELSH